MAREQSLFRFIMPLLSKILPNLSFEHLSSFVSTDVYSQSRDRFEDSGSTPDHLTFVERNSLMAFTET